MIDCLQTRVTALYFEFETVVKFYNLGARTSQSEIRKHNEEIQDNRQINNIQKKEGLSGSSK